MCRIVGRWGRTWLGRGDSDSLDSRVKRAAVQSPWTSGFNYSFGMKGEKYPECLQIVLMVFGKDRMKRMFSPLTLCSSIDGPS